MCDVDDCPPEQEAKTPAGWSCRFQGFVSEQQIVSLLLPVRENEHTLKTD